MGSGCSSPFSSDNAASVIERVCPRFVPVIFPWFQYFSAAIHNMPPFAFGIHNEQYDSDVVIIWRL